MIWELNLVPAAICPDRGDRRADGEGCAERHRAAQRLQLFYVPALDRDGRRGCCITGGGVGAGVSIAFSWARSIIPRGEAKGLNRLLFAPSLPLLPVCCSSMAPWSSPWGDPRHNTPGVSPRYIKNPPRNRCAQRGDLRCWQITGAMTPCLKPASSSPPGSR